MTDQSEKSTPKEVSIESKAEQHAARAGSDQAQADMPEHMQQISKDKSAFDKAGLLPRARSHVSETFGRPQILEEIDGEEILHVAEVSGGKVDKTSASHLSYTKGLEAARNKATTPDEAAEMEVKFTEQYIEKKLQEANVNTGKDPAELLNAHKYNAEDPAHAGTFEIPQNIAERHSDGSVLLKINVSESVQETDAKPLANNPEGWIEAGRKIAELPMDKQLEIIGSGLAAGIDQYQHEENQRAWGRVIGTVEGLGEVSVNLAKIADFSAALILDDQERAGRMGAEFGQSVGETIVGGVKLFDSAHQYLFNIGFTGDYAKPFRDVAIIGDALNRKWSELPPKEQERIVSRLSTQLLAEGVITASGASIIGKAPKFTKILDTVAKETSELPVLAGGKAHRAADAVEEAVRDVTEQMLDGDIELRKTADKLDDLTTGDVPTRRHLLPAEVDKDELVPVPEDFAERMLHYNASSIEIRDARNALPEELKRTVIDGYLGGRVRVVESMTDVADLLRRADPTVTDEYIEQLAGVLVTIMDDAGNPIGDGVFVALTTYDRTSGKRHLVENTAGVFRHELSHAVDKLVGSDGMLLSESPGLMRLYELDAETLIERLTTEELDILKNIYLTDSSAVPRELFAQVLASKLGGCTFQREQDLIQKAYPSIWNLIFGGD